MNTAAGTVVADEPGTLNPDLQSEELKTNEQMGRMRGVTILGFSLWV